MESGLQCMGHRLKVAFWLHAKCPANDAAKCPTGIPIDAWKKLFMDNGESINWALMLLIPSLLLLPPTSPLPSFVSLPDLAWPSGMDSTSFFNITVAVDKLMNLCVRVHAVHNGENSKCHHHGLRTNWAAYNPSTCPTTGLFRWIYADMGYWQPGARNRVMLEDAFGHALEYSLVYVPQSQSLQRPQWTLKSSSSPAEPEYKTEEVTSDPSGPIQLPFSAEIHVKYESPLLSVQDI